MSDATNLCSSYDLTRPVSALMEHLKEKGLGATERAIIFRDHVALCFIEVDGLEDPHGIGSTPVARFKREFSKRIQELHWNISSDGDLSDYGNLQKSTEKAFNETMALTFGNDLNEINKTGRLLLAINRNDNTETSLDYDSWLDIASGSTRRDWADIRAMDIDEDDLALQISRKTPFHAEKTVGLKIRTLDKGFRIAREAAKSAGIPQLTMDVVSGSDPNNFLDLARGIRKANDSFVSIGANNLGLNRVGLYMAPFTDGTSGVMFEADKHISAISGQAVPRVGVSTRCGFNYSEVIIHEYLHAHDAILGQVEINLEIKRGRSLLSDQLQNIGVDQEKSPLMKAWTSLVKGINQVQQEPIRLADLIRAEEALGKRWSTLGVNADALNLAAKDWRESVLPERDDVLKKHVITLFDGTPFEITSDFRSEVICAEIKILEKAKTSENFGGAALFRQFLDNFDGMLSNENSENYGKGYFEDTAEKVARAAQNTLDFVQVRQDNHRAEQQKQDVTQPNPYEKRWLVYADQQQSEAIGKNFKDFFANPAVKQAYSFLEEAPSDLLTKTHRTKIQTESMGWFGNSEPQVKQASARPK